MGIKGLSSYIKKQCDSAYVEMDISLFKNRFVAIDANSYMHRFAAGSQTAQQYLSKFIGLIIGMRSENVYPVFVFDGGAPIEKKDEQQKRWEEQNNIRMQIEKLEREDDEFGSNQEQIANLSKRLTLVPPEYKIGLFELLKVCGIPCIKASDEAERFCAALLMEKKVALVLSPDSDLLVYDIPIAATEFDQYKRKFTITSPSHIRESLELTREQWVDFCIMCGCDYNQNINGIGPVKSMALIKKYGTLDNMSNLDITCLNHKRCRELFEYQSTNNTVIVNNYPTEDFYDFFYRWGLNDYAKKLLNVLSAKRQH